MRRQLRGNARVRCALLACVLAAAFALNASAASRANAAPAPVYPPFSHQLFDTPIELNGCFGDRRSNHFHAGLDLATGGAVGRAIHVPADAVLKRVRSSGVGYGRSLYYETADGRLMVFGHLDAFAEPVATYVAAIQDSSGKYEQDLWPGSGRFRVTAGTVIGWTGRSGTGGPHLHVEIRRGDMAINPLLAGLTLDDRTAPRINCVTLVSLDGTSAPVTLAFGARDTVEASASGRLRVVVEAVDAESDGTFDVAPWRTQLTNDTEWVRCEFDSASWATDMPQSDFVYDSGRYTEHGKLSLVIGAPDGMRPVVIGASAPPNAAAGVVTLDEQHPAVTLLIEAEDLAGHRARRVLRLRAGRPIAAAPVAAETGDAILGLGNADTGRLSLRGLGSVEFPKGALFEHTRLTLTRAGATKRAGELAPAGRIARIGPATTPLAKPADIALKLDSTIPSPKVGLYRDAGVGWEYVGAEHNPSAATIGGATRHLGRFALFKDTRAPRGTFAPPPRAIPAGAYPRWAIEAPLVDKGSGVDASETYFIIDGRRVPSEWDSVIETLRWRPLRAPSSGRHKVIMVATDRAGNTLRTSGAFVVN